MFGASFSGDEIIGRCVQPMTWTSASGKCANPCNNASGAVPNHGCGLSYCRYGSRLSVVRMAMTISIFDEERRCKRILPQQQIQIPASVQEIIWDWIVCRDRHAIPKKWL